MLLSRLRRPWGSRARRGDHVTVIEWRDDALLALRARRTGTAMPEVLETASCICAPDQREAALARLARQGWFANSRVILMLGIRQRQLAMIPVPPVPEAEWADAARWQLQGALDYPPEETVLDVLHIGHDEPPARQQLAVFASRRSALAAWLAPLAARRIRLEAVEVADCAQRNLSALHPAMGRPVAMLSWREDSVVFSVTRGAEVLISRSFDAASMTAGTGHDAMPADDIAALADRVGLQLQRMLDTLERRSSAMAPAQIIVLGHPQHSALLTQCAELTGLRVVPLDLAPWLHGARPAPDGAPPASDFFHLLGAALRPAPAGAAA